MIISYHYILLPSIFIHIFVLLYHCTRSFVLFFVFFLIIFAFLSLFSLLLCLLLLLLANCVISVLSFVRFSGMNLYLVGENVTKSLFARPFSIHFSFHSYFFLSIFILILYSFLSIILFSFRLMFACLILLSSFFLVSQSLSFIFTKRFISVLFSTMF